MNRDNLEKIIELRHFMHAHPELSLQEEATIDLLVNFLKENTTLEVVKKDGWFYAVMPGEDLREGMKKETPAASPIALRADMDALPIDEWLDLPYASVVPGVSHKCGHDGHSAALCGVALELSQKIVPRTIYLIFQPAEEIGSGAQICADLIEEKGISEIYAFHNLGGYPEGELVYRRGLTQPASEGLTIRLHGKQSHASAPEEGKNPASAIAKIALYSQEFLRELQELQGFREQEDRGMSRPGDFRPEARRPGDFRQESCEGRPEAFRPEGCEVRPRASRPESCETRPSVNSREMILCTVVGMNVGTGDFGIAAGEGSICLTLRAEREEQMKVLERRLLDYAGELAAGEGLVAEHEISDYFPETRNHDDALRKVVESAERIGVKSTEMRELWRASEDFGHYLKRCSGAMFYIGNGESYPALHTKEYDFNDRVLPTAVDLFMELLELEQPEV